ncbi:BnaA07g02610D [Brassica napus]|uniref:BnaA07g02610D protein n=1 Tax=Brassica napus TaxID=3708 RepID=A0A078GG25_BRANA|nr:BnaA07g02610D [Brassica napus]
MCSGFEMLPVGIKNIMPRILLGSNLLKKGVSWGGLKGSVIFALGFHSHGVLFPNPERVLQEATESLAQAESLSGEYYAQLDELIENKKVLDEALQLYLAGLAELEELKEAKGL